MYLITGNKSECCGCSACQQICGHNAIEMKADEEGFLFPVKNLSACVNCGLCEKVCSFASPSYRNSTKGVYAAMAKDPSVRSKSSSGAIFYILAKKIIDRGGIVYGAVLDQDMQVHHKMATCQNELSSLRGSKYVQSELKNTFKEIRALLKKGKLVYFTGTGCQVAGLKSFLMKDYPNLFTSDIVCHGVPNQLLFNEHITYLEHKYKGKIIDYQFRNNDRWGVCESFTIITEAQTRKTYKTTAYSLSPFLYSFMHAMTYRLSCYNCPFAKIPRQGDITLADYWGAKKYYPNLDISRGISLIVINNEKGKTFLNDVEDELIVKDSNIANAAEENRNLIDHTKLPEIRQSIFTKIRKNGYEKIANTIFRPRHYFLILIKSKIRDMIGIENYMKLRKLIKL